MAYKTLMLQLYRPSRRKQALMDAALLHYSQALQALLDWYRDDIEALSQSESPVTQRQLLGLIDKDAAKKLNDFEVQPLKDSLKKEFAAVASAYLAQKRENPRVGYPLAYLDASQYAYALSGCIDRFDRGQIGQNKLEYTCSKLIGRADKARSLYFGRYDLHRDYCLLYDEFKDRFYAKLYLLNRSGGIPNENPTSGLSLKYVAPGMPAMPNKAGKVRYIVIPLAFGKNQYADLKKALKNPELLHTARLTKKENRYYLMVHIKCGTEPAFAVSAAMGISRSALGGLNYTVSDENGVIRKRGRINGQHNQNQLVFTLAKKVVKIAGDNRSQVVLEANGGRNDRMPVQCNSGAAPLSVQQYTRLAEVLAYKLPEKRLPPPVEVSANELFFTCPRCDGRTRRNRVSDELFVCIHCGYASESEWIGSENLAKRLLRYQKDKVPVTVIRKENSLLFYNKILDFMYEISKEVTDFSPMYLELSRFIQSMEGQFESDSKKYAVWKKLRQASRIEDAVRLVWK